MSVSIKIYGERNSGTNYLEKLLTKNLHAEVLNFRFNWFNVLLLKLVQYDFVEDWLFFLQRKQILGWKHGCPRVDEIKNYKDNRLIIITITKNPYSYLLSLHRNPYHVKGGKEPLFSNLIKTKWDLRRRDFCNLKYVKSPIELWNVKNKSYLDLRNRVTNTVVNISYESLIENPELFIKTIARKENIQQKNDGSFINVEASTKGANLTFKDYQDYYLNADYSKSLSETSITYINQNLDQTIVEYMDYRVLSPSDN